MTYKQKISAYKKMCELHDLNYHYSDCSKKYNKGVKTFKELREFSKTLIDTDAKDIYNQVVDKRIKAEFRDEYYLK